MEKTWQIGYRVKGESGEARQTEIIRTLLKHRGITSAPQKQAFFQPMHPQKISLKDVGIGVAEVRKAAKRLKQAIADQELIIVYGDYDADGITATAILWETLHDLGGKVFPFIPHREEHGYGLKQEGVDSIIEKYGKPDLIVTVDNGIVAFSGAQYCRDHKIDLIISDHHQVKQEARSNPALTESRRGREKQEVRKRKPVYPEALAIVHTDQLAGAGVSWFLAREVAAALKQPMVPNDKLELAAIGTVADMVPLLKTNRSLAKFGLEQLKHTKRPGLIALFTEAQVQPVQVTTYHINFVIAPRLNAMGRLEHALDSLRLLCTRDEQRAIKLSVEIGATNRERQDLTFSALRHAENLVVSQGVADKRLLFIAHESYDQGVVGLVAGKLVEKYWRPTIVVSQEKIYSKGSVRSIPGVNIIELLRTFEEEFVDLGGHPMAAGFTIETEKIPQLQQRLETLAQEQIAEELLSPVLEIECQVELADIDQGLYAKLDQFEPFGMGNRLPVLAAGPVKIVEWRLVGKDERHVKLQLKAKSYKLEAVTLDAIFFNGTDPFANLDTQKPVDVAFQVDENEWNGRTGLQLMIKDVRPAA